MSDSSLIEINLSALDRNLDLLRRLVGDACVICPIVKADAYGLRAGVIARRLAGRGCHMLAVYSPAEAAGVFASGYDGLVLVLMPVRSEAELEVVAEPLGADRLHMTLHDEEQRQGLEAIAERRSCTIPVHLEIDTGLSRGGSDSEAASRLLDGVGASPSLRLAGLSTHFASADCDEAMTRRQMDRFEQFVADHERLLDSECVLHSASTFATLRHARYHRSMVRVGLAWAGYGPEWMRGDHLLAGGSTLQPILRWTSRIIQLRRIKSGARVGYGSRWTAQRETVLGHVPVGYASGYPMALATTDEKAGPACVGVLDRDDHVRVLGYAPVVGAVYMDQITIDLTDLVREHGDSSIGLDSGVELIAPDSEAPNHLPTLAREAGTIPHEMMCRLHSRIRRVYREGNLSDCTIETKPGVSVRA